MITIKINMATLRFTGWRHIIPMSRALDGIALSQLCLQACDWTANAGIGVGGGGAGPSSSTGLNGLNLGAKEDFPQGTLVLKKVCS